jgi:hypothetical protein
MRRRLGRAISRLALTVGLVSACDNPCFLVVGCKDSGRIAVDGRILTAESGRPVPATNVTLYATYSGRVDSTKTVSDGQGLFSLSLPISGAPPTTVALRVMPPGNPGYTVSPLDCKPVAKFGDACVLSPIVAQPTFPLFQFLYRSDLVTPAANVLVTFKRTGGSTFYGPKVTDPSQVTTDAQGVGNLFPPGFFAAGYDPVIGDLTVELPPPIGTTIRHNYKIQPNIFFNARPLAAQGTGPALHYVMAFLDSATGRFLPGVEVRYQRLSGIPTNAQSFRVLSTTDGLAFFVLTPLAQGTITGDFSVTPLGSSITTPMKGVSLTTFDADSSIVLSRWKVGTTGILYPVPPS